MPKNAHDSKSGNTSWWLIGLAVFAALWVIGTLIGPRKGTGLTTGIRATVQHEGAKGAWFAVDDESFEAMIGGQNSQSEELLNDLAAKRRIFREPNGSQVLVLKDAVGSVFVRVREGVNVGSEGWVQKELLAADHE